jgi:hypothetical protein
MQFQDIITTRKRRQLTVGFLGNLDFLWRAESLGFAIKQDCILKK